MATRRDTGLHGKLASIRDAYVAAVNAAVEAGRYELINELAEDYENERRLLCARVSAVPVAEVTGREF